MDLYGFSFIHFFIKLTDGYGIIIPKEPIENILEFKNLLISRGIEYTEHNNWVWKIY